MSRVVRALVVGVGAAVVSALTVTPVDAQGRGNAYGRGRSGSPSAPTHAASTPSTPGAPQPGQGDGVPFFIPSGAGLRNFGAWLDDASVLAPGMGWTSVSFGYWRTPFAREIDVPMVDGGVGVARRVQVGFSLPVYHVNEPGGPVSRGLGDVYLNAKIQLRDPAAGARGLGFAVIPVLEVLSFEPAQGESRVQWALPVSMEVQRPGWRAFGTTGYFSRGSLFAAAGVEVAARDRLWLVGTISQSHSIHSDDLSASLGLAQTRTDVGAGATFAAAPNLAIFGNVGRTISRQDLTSTTFSVTAGVSYMFTAWN